VTPAEGKGHGQWNRELDQESQAPLMGQNLSLLNLSLKVESVPVLKDCLSIDERSWKERPLYGRSAGS
jgi:hypothetical protein